MKIRESASAKQISRKYLTIYGLEGFNSNLNKIEIAKGIVIKKLSVKERKAFYERAAGMGSRKSYSHLIENKYFLCYDYEKIPSRKIYDSEDFENLEMFRRLFRVFQEGEIDIQFFQKFGYSETNGKYESLGFSMSPSNFWYVGNNYLINGKGLKKFKKFSSQFLTFHFAKTKTINIAVKRLDFSYQRLDIEDQVIDLMIGFEALFSSGSSEITYRLSLRASNFLSNHYDKQVLFEFIKKCYHLRSAIVHGSHTKAQIKMGEDIIANDQIVTNIRPVLRQAILNCFENYSPQTIGSLIADIDKMILK